MARKTRPTEDRKVSPLRSRNSSKILSLTTGAPVSSSLGKISNDHVGSGPTTESPKQKPLNSYFTTDELRTRTAELRHLIDDLSAFDVNVIQHRSDQKPKALTERFNRTLADIFGRDTQEYKEHSVWSLDTLPLTISGRWYPLPEVREAYQKGINDAITKLSSLLDALERQLEALGGENPRHQGSDLYEEILALETSEDNSDSGVLAIDGDDFLAGETIEQLITEKQSTICVPPKCTAHRETSKALVFPETRRPAEETTDEPLGRKQIVLLKTLREWMGVLEWQTPSQEGAIDAEYDEPSTAPMVLKGSVEDLDGLQTDELALERPDTAPTPLESAEARKSEHEQAVEMALQMIALEPVKQKPDEFNPQSRLEPEPDAPLSLIALTPVVPESTGENPGRDQAQSFDTHNGVTENGECISLDILEEKLNEPGYKTLIEEIFDELTRGKILLETAEENLDEIATNERGLGWLDADSLVPRTEEGLKVPDRDEPPKETVIPESSRGRANPFVFSERPKDKARLDILCAEDLRTHLEHLRRRVDDLRSFDVDTVEQRLDPKVRALTDTINHTLESIFGRSTFAYWQHAIPSLDTMTVAVGGLRLSSREVRQAYRRGIHNAVMKLNSILQTLEDELGDLEPQGRIESDGIITDDEYVQQIKNIQLNRRDSKGRP